jgi:hypothetical protein
MLSKLESCGAPDAVGKGEEEFFKVRTTENVDDN